jgi:hypothetical protein
MVDLSSFATGATDSSKWRRTNLRASVCSTEVWFRFGRADRS